MIIVSNTGPLIALAKVQLGFLNRLASDGRRSRLKGGPETADQAPEIDARHPVPTGSHLRL